MLQAKTLLLRSVIVLGILGLANGRALADKNMNKLPAPPKPVKTKPANPAVRPDGMGGFHVPFFGSDDKYIGNVHIHPQRGDWNYLGVDGGRSSGTVRNGLRGTQLIETRPWYLPNRQVGDMDRHALEGLLNGSTPGPIQFLDPKTGNWLPGRLGPKH